MDAKNSLCRPSQAGAAAGAVTGLVVWALVSFVPAFHDGVPAAVTAVIPFALAWLGHVAAAYLAGPSSQLPRSGQDTVVPPASGRPVSPQPGAGGTIRIFPPASGAPPAG